jgi:DNA topoisomerase-6 subunit B
VTTVTRPPEVYRGWPFQVEAGLAFGGSVQDFSLMRFANRVPLLYQQGICAVTRAVQETDWRRYRLQVNKGIDEPLAIFVHLCSVWVPFTSESKEAIANYDIIIKEIKLALQECARKLSLWLSGKRKHAMLKKKKSTFERYAGETARALGIITDRRADELREKILALVTDKWGEMNGGQEPGEETGSGEKAGDEDPGNGDDEDGEREQEGY